MTDIFQNILSVSRSLNILHSPVNFVFLSAVLAITLLILDAGAEASPASIPSVSPMPVLLPREVPIAVPKHIPKAIPSVL